MQCILPLVASRNPVAPKAALLGARQSFSSSVKKDLAAVKKKLKALEGDLVKRLEEATGKLAGDDAEHLVVEILRENLDAILVRYVAEHRREVVSAFERWWDKYRVPLTEIERERDEAATTLNDMLGRLGYVD